MIKKFQPMILGIFLCLTGISLAEKSPSPDQSCLAQVIYHESGNQSLMGQYAVGEVILNRVRAGVAETVCGVVHQHVGKSWQFGNFVNNKKLIPTSRRKYFYDIAQQVLDGDTGFFLPSNVLYFNNTVFDKTRFKLYGKIGQQYFFTRRNR